VQILRNALLMLSIVALGACNNSSFTGGGSKNGKPAIDDKPDTGDITQGESEEFALSGPESVKGLVDMIWVIDNSRSMTAEAAQVRSNLEKFLTKLKESVNVKLALISKKGTSGNAVELSSEALAAGNMQLDVVVNSTDGTQIALKKQSELSPIFRPEAQRVFVFVTDDNSALPAAKFLQQATLDNNGKQPKVFSFIGKGPCRDKFGTVYTELATSTGAETFDVCESDWTAQFEKLTAAVEKLVPAKHDFKLKTDKPVTILAIEIDGNAVDITKFRVENQQLICDDPVLIPDTAQKLVVRYQSQP
jgi:hypothetical protein